MINLIPWNLVLSCRVKVQKTVTLALAAFINPNLNDEHFQVVQLLQAAFTLAKLFHEFRIYDAFTGLESVCWVRIA
jgi:hypothetical protein